MDLLLATAELERLTDEHQKFLNTIPHRPWNGSKEKTIHHDSDQYYPYIPLYTRSFLTAMAAVLPKAKSFFDVGCGMGDKLMLVNKIAPTIRVGGLDFHEPYVKAAQKNAPEAEVIHCDAFNYDGYKQWDVLYAYRPISNYELMGKLEDHIMRKMRRGATFVIFGPSITSKYVKTRLKPHERGGYYFWRKP